jgi:hypothetical protein
MGASYSKSNRKQREAAKINNIKELFNININENNEILDSLNLENVNDNKNALPQLMGGFVNNNNNNNKSNNKNIFDLIAALEDEHFQTGGDNVNNTNYGSASSDSNAMNHIKELVLAELNSGLNDNENGCGCGGDSKTECIHGGAKKKTNTKIKTKTKTNTKTDTKTKKNTKKMIDTDSDGKLQISENNGLSVFPFNSSDASVSASERNFRMIRRKI